MNDIARAVFADRYPVAEHYEQILRTKGIEWGLMGPREGDRLWDRHILNSTAISSLVPEGATVADVGSGAGLPGVPLAILRPDLRITLVEPLLRRATFLTECVEELGLDGQVTVVRSRAEDLRRELGVKGATNAPFDVVTCRAVAPLTKLLKWCSPLFLPDGQLVALKGSTAQDELADAHKQLQAARATAEIRHIRAHADTEPTQAIVVSPLR